MGAERRFGSGVTGRFARESFRPGVVSPVGHFALGRFALGRFARGSFRPNMVDRFVHMFIQALRIEVKYVLVYKGVEGCMGFGYSSGLFIQYLLLRSFIF